MNTSTHEDYQVFDIYDAAKKQMRSFSVVPNEPRFKPRCRNGLHQFAPNAATCECGGVRREEVDE